MPNQDQVKYVPAGTGPMYSGPGDRVRFPPPITEALMQRMMAAAARNGLEFVGPE